MHGFAQVFTGFYRILPVTGILQVSDGPFVCVMDEFLLGDMPGRFGEMDRLDFTVDLGAERGGDGVQTGGGDFLEVAFIDLLLEAFELAGEDLPALVALAEDPLGQPLGLGGAEVGDFELVLPAPLDEGGFGNVELDGDAIKAPALRAQEDEAVDGFLVSHIPNFLANRITRRVRRDITMMRGRAGGA